MSPCDRRRLSKTGYLLVRATTPDVERSYGPYFVHLHVDSEKGPPPDGWEILEESGDRSPAALCKLSDLRDGYLAVLRVTNS